MNIVRLVLVAVFICMPINLVLAQEKMKLSELAYKTLIGSRSLKCEFLVGVSTTWDTGKPVSEKATMSGAMVFDSIDHKNNSARLIGNIGASDLMTIATAESITFLEVTDSGNVTITTVFPEFVGKGRKFIGVHTRHVSANGPIPSQYHGACETWQ